MNNECIELEENYCKNMINSIIAYSPIVIGKTTAEEILSDDEKPFRNYLKEYVNKLGRERVLELIQGQLDSIKGVRKSVYADNKGTTYNSIIWKEEEWYNI